MIARLFTRLRIALQAWNASHDLAYLEMYHAACARQPQPDEALLRHLREQIEQRIVILAQLAAARQPLR